MQNINVWFDNWFSSAFNLMEMIKKNEDHRPIKIFGTHYKRMGYSIICDEFHIRDKYDETDSTSVQKYILWAKTFCIKNHIDIFFPCKFHIPICEKQDEFLKECGTKVVVPKDLALTTQLNSKLMTAILIEGEEICTPAPCWELNNISQVEEFRQTLKANNFNCKKLCIKPDFGTGAHGFLVLDLPTDYYKLDKILTDKKNPYIIMPYLEGNEVSIDCLKVDNGYITIPRSKNLTNRIQTIDHIESYLKVAEEMCKFLDLDCPFNLQFKRHEDFMYLLEINTRMSGGVHLDYLAGVNIPYLTIKRYLGEKVNVSDFKDIQVCNVEKGVIVY